MMDESRRVAAVARNLAASRFLYKVDAVAMVESEEDIEFWRLAFNKAKAGFKVKFLPGEITDTGELHKGKSICLKYKSELNRYFVVCVDSDLDKFVRPEIFALSRYVFQTHTYSWENHYCNPVELNRLYSEYGLNAFDFNAFLKDYSKLVYPALIGIIAGRCKAYRGWHLDDLSSIVSLQVTKQGILESNGIALLDRIEANIKSWMGSQVVIPDNDWEETETLASSVGLSPENAYLYMRGHNIYDLILRIGNALSDGNHDFRTEVLRRSVSFSGYLEIENVVSDIKTAL